MERIQEGREEMKIAITGAAGFIGSHLAKTLEQQGHNLCLMDDFSRGSQKYLDFLGVDTKCEKIDIRNYGKIYPLLWDMDVVYHTASKIGGMQFLHGSPEIELSALQENLIIDRNVFKACIEHNIKKVIYTSSISIYNTTSQSSPNALFSEKSLSKQPLDPEGGYGWAKYIGEMQLNMMAKCGIKTGIARIFKSYGPCDDYSDKSGQVVCMLCRKAVNYPTEPFIVWGDGSVTRNLVYIDDLVRGFIKLEKYMDKESLTVNFGGETPISVKKIAKGIVKASGKRIKIEYDESRKSGPQSRIPDLSLAKEKLDWSPKIGLKKGLKETYEWMEQELNEE